MNRLFLISICFFTSVLCYGQTGYLFVKKGIRKKQIYTEGSPIYLRLQNDQLMSGRITRLMNDTIFLSGLPVPRKDVKEVIIYNTVRKPFHISAQDLLLITAGAAMVTGGLTLSKQAEFKEALIAGSVIGYGPLGVGYLKNKISLKRKKYKIGKKFHLQLIDFYLPPKRAF